MINTTNFRKVFNSKNSFKPCKNTLLITIVFYVNIKSHEILLNFPLNLTLERKCNMECLT